MSILFKTQLLFICMTHLDKKRDDVALTSIKQSILYEFTGVHFSFTQLGMHSFQKRHQKNNNAEYQDEMLNPQDKNG